MIKKLSKALKKNIVNFIVSLNKEGLTWNHLQKIKKKIPDQIWPNLYRDFLKKINKNEERKRNKKINNKDDSEKFFINKKAKKICEQIVEKKIDFENKLAKRAKYESQPQLIYATCNEDDQLTQKIFKEACSIFNKQEDQSLSLNMSKISKNHLSPEKTCDCLGISCLLLACCPFMWPCFCYWCVKDIEETSFKESICMEKSDLCNKVPAFALIIQVKK